MNNVTRNYYVPRNQVGRYIINRIVDKVPCSVDDIKVNRESNTICVTFSFKEQDTQEVEKILKVYDIL